MLGKGGNSRHLVDGKLVPESCCSTMVKNVRIVRHSHKGLEPMRGVLALVKVGM